MSLHYEVVYSLFLVDRTPVGLLDELRWHLGLSPRRPDGCVVAYDQPVMLPNPDSHLPGGETVALRRQYRFTVGGNDRHAWGLHARLSWLDDHWAETWWQVASWLAPHAEDGYAGFFREENDERPTLLVMRDGRPCLVDSDGTRPL